MERQSDKTDPGAGIFSISFIMPGRYRRRSSIINKILFLYGEGNKNTFPGQGGRIWLSQEPKRGGDEGYS
jgi:hypothetical protein